MYSASFARPRRCARRAICHPSCLLSLQPLQAYMLPQNTFTQNDAPTLTLGDSSCPAAPTRPPSSTTPRIAVFQSGVLVPTAVRAPRKRAALDLGLRGVSRGWGLPISPWRAGTMRRAAKGALGTFSMNGPSDRARVPSPEPLVEQPSVIFVLVPPVIGFEFGSLGHLALSEDSA